MNEGIEPKDFVENQSCFLISFLKEKTHFEMIFLQQDVLILKKMFLIAFHHLEKENIVVMALYDF
jgi:hypothetical protein